MKHREVTLMNTLIHMLSCFQAIHCRNLTLLLSTLPRITCRMQCEMFCLPTYWLMDTIFPYQINLMFMRKVVGLITQGSSQIDTVSMVTSFSFHYGPSDDDMIPYIEQNMETKVFKGLLCSKRSNPWFHFTPEISILALFEYASIPTRYECLQGRFSEALHVGAGK